MSSKERNITKDSRYSKAKHQNNVTAEYAFDFPVSQWDRDRYAKIFQVARSHEVPREEEIKSLEDLMMSFVNSGKALAERISLAKERNTSQVENEQIAKSLEIIKSNIKDVESQLSNRMNKLKSSVNVNLTGIESLNEAQSESSTRILALEKLTEKLQKEVDLKAREKIDQNLALQKVMQRLEKVEREFEQSKKKKRKEREKINLRDIEDIMVRFAAFGDERIEHLEIVGNGERTSEGASVRKVVMESQLGSDEYEQFKVPKSWSSHSDSKTINLNFKQLASMFNDVVLRRLVTYESQIGQKVGRLEKKVEIIQKLLKAKSKPEKPVGTKLENIPKVNHQGRASAGRAAMQRKTDKEKIKLQ